MFIFYFPINFYSSFDELFHIHGIHWPMLYMMPFLDTAHQVHPLILNTTVFLLHLLELWILVTIFSSVWNLLYWIHWVWCLILTHEMVSSGFLKSVYTVSVSFYVICPGIRSKSHLMLSWGLSIYWCGYIVSTVIYPYLAWLLYAVLSMGAVDIG